MLSRFCDALQLCILHYEHPDVTEEIYSHDKAGGMEKFLTSNGGRA